MLFEGWGTRFPKVSWLCVDGWIQLDLGISSLGDIFCVPCIPNTRLHNQKVSGVYKWEFKYLVGYLSNRHMIRYGIYHMFVFGLFCEPNPLFCFELWYSSCFNVKCWFHTFPKWCSHTSMWIPILLITEVVMLILFQPVRFSSRWSHHSSHPEDQL